MQRRRPVQSPTARQQQSQDQNLLFGLRSLLLYFAFPITCPHHGIFLHCLSVGSSPNPSHPTGRQCRPLGERCPPDLRRRPRARRPHQSPPEVPLPRGLGRRCSQVTPRRSWRFCAFPTAAGTQGAVARRGPARAQGSLPDFSLTHGNEVLPKAQAFSPPRKPGRRKSTGLCEVQEEKKHSRRAAPTRAPIISPLRGPARVRVSPVGACQSSSRWSQARGLVFLSVVLWTSQTCPEVEKWYSESPRICLPSFKGSRPLSCNLCLPLLPPPCARRQTQTRGHFIRKQLSQCVSLRSKDTCIFKGRKLSRKPPLTRRWKTVAPGEGPEGLSPSAVPCGSAKSCPCTASPPPSAQGKRAPCFPEEKTEAQRGNGVCPWSRVAGLAGEQGTQVAARPLLVGFHGGGAAPPKPQGRGQEQSAPPRGESWAATEEEGGCRAGNYRILTLALHFQGCLSVS